MGRRKMPEEQKVLRKKIKALEKMLSEYSSVISYDYETTISDYDMDYIVGPSEFAERDKDSENEPQELLYRIQVLLIEAFFAKLGITINIQDFFDLDIEFPPETFESILSEVTANSEISGVSKVFIFSPPSEMSSFVDSVKFNCGEEIATRVLSMKNFEEEMKRMKLMEDDKQDIYEYLEAENEYGGYYDGDGHMDFEKYSGNGGCTPFGALESRNCISFCTVADDPLLPYASKANERYKRDVRVPLLNMAIDNVQPMYYTCDQARELDKGIIFHAVAEFTDSGVGIHEYSTFSLMGCEAYVWLALADLIIYDLDYDYDFLPKELKGREKEILPAFEF